MHPFATSAASVSRKALDEDGPRSEAVWAELHTFLALAKLKSASRAAEMLRVSRTTVNQHVQRLHDRLGGPLVVFTKAGAILTPKGEQLALRLQSVDDEIASAAITVRQGARIDGVVRVSITEGLGFTFLTPAIRDFTHRYPGIQLHIRNPTNYRSLLENQTDLMVGFGLEEATDISSRRLGRLHYSAFAARRYIDRKGMPTNPASFAQHEFIDTERYSARGGIWDSWHALTARGRVVHYCDTSVNYGLMVKAGLGIGLLPTYNLMDPQFVLLDLGVRIHLPLYALALKQRLKSKPVERVHEFICGLLDESNPWLSPEMRTDLGREEMPDGYRMLFNL